MRRPGAATLVTIGLVLAAVAAAAWFYASPYLVLPADRGDAETVGEHVDFPALRQSVKEALRAHPDVRNNPLARFGLALSPSITDALVDALVSPENVRQMLRGRPPRVARSGGGHPRAGDRGGDAGGGGRRREASPELRYESWDRFLVTFPHPRRPQDAYTLVWQRRGLTWVLVGVRLPAPAA
jgi:hypothetical protein